LGGRDFSAIISRLKRSRVKRVLDLGCGLGYLSVALARVGLHVTAADISFRAIEKLQSRAREEGLSIKTAVCPAQEINRINRKFDVVICNSLVDRMTLKDAGQAVSNIKELSRRGGVAYLSFDGREDTGNDP